MSAVENIRAALAAVNDCTSIRGREVAMRDLYAVTTTDKLAEVLAHVDTQERRIEGYKSQANTDLSMLIRQNSEIERLKDDLSYIERMAVYHGQKPHMTPEATLSCIQHYPPISTITKGYDNGITPDTLNPFNLIERLKADAARYQWLKQAKGLTLESERGAPWTREDGSTFSPSHRLCVGGTQFGPEESLDAAIDAAMGQP